MRCLPAAQKPRLSSTTAGDGFTLMELMAVMAIISVLAAIILPALANARERSRSIYCVNNTRQLTLAWHLYADDHEGMLPYNVPMETPARTNLNWVNNVMTWDLSPDNTNLNTISEAALGPYVLGVTSIYRCPSDRVLSAVQIAAGWTQRIRSYSMNAMVGNMGSSNSVNANNPGYRQFLNLDQIAHPTEIFVFLDEHPDSIDDGYFIDTEPASSAINMSSVPINEWRDLPASYHNRSAAFCFADGHASLHHWQNGSTIAPATPYEANLPIQIPNSATEDSDFEWLIEHMSVEN